MPSPPSSLGVVAATPRVNPAACVKLFTTRTIRRLAQTGLPTSIQDRLTATGLPLTGSVRDVMAAAWAQVNTPPYWDYAYRVRLAQAGQTPLMIGEVRVQQSRADVIRMHNGLLEAVEIKSARDTLTRLAQQLANYQTAFPLTSVACAPTHTPTVIAQTPAAVGIYQLDDTGQFTTVRHPTPTSAHMTPAAIHGCLREPEAITVLETLNAQPQAAMIKTIPNMTRYASIQSMLASHRPTQLACTMATVWATTRAPRPHVTTLLATTPPWLHPLITDLALSKPGASRLATALDAPACPPAP